MTVGSLFTGIGGLDLGFERAGFEIAWQVEIDPYCRRVLAKHWPTVPCYEDIRDVGAHNLAPVDVLVGGFPCQDISNAGKRAGITGERSGLWSEYARLVRELRPRYVCVENVAALLHRGIDVVLGELAESGYDAEWQVLPAAAVGAPHLRERVFLVAHTEYSGLYGATVDTRQTDCGNGQPEAPYNRYRGRAFTQMGSSCPRVFRRPPAGAWEPEPAMARVVDGVSDGVDRIRALGNAVVPQVAQYVAECIAEHASAQQQEDAA